MATSPNRRQRVFEFATPKVADLVVVEVVDVSRKAGSAETISDSAYGSNHPNTDKFPDFKLVLIKNADEDQGQFQYWYYVKDRASQDDYNWEFQAAGGSNPLYDTVVRTYVTLRSGYETNSPKIGYNTSVDTEALLNLGQKKDNNTFMPSGDTDVTPFSGTVLAGTDSSGAAILATRTNGVKYDTDYILFERRQVRSGEETLDSLYVVEQRVFIKKIPIRGTDVDAEFNFALRSKQTIFHKDELPVKTTVFGESDTTLPTNPSKNTSQVFALGNAATAQGAIPFFGSKLIDGGGSNKFGILCEGRQLSDNWYSISEKEVVKTDANKLIRSYTTYQNYTWPAVLDRIADENWTRNDGGTDTIVYPIYKRGAYSGPTKVLVQLYWTDSDTGFPTSTSQDGGHTHIGTINPMLPEPLVFQTPIATVNVPPTLHNQILVTATTGSNHPVYNYIGTRWLFLKTNHVDWPDTIIIADSQRPYRGGFLREKITAYKPVAST